jgi:hypothetical protein
VAGLHHQQWLTWYWLVKQNKKKKQHKGERREYFTSGVFCLITSRFTFPSRGLRYIQIFTGENFRTLCPIGYLFVDKYEIVAYDCVAYNEAKYKVIYFYKQVAQCVMKGWRYPRGAWLAAGGATSGYSI